jgi:hypothetical protein
MIGLWMILKIFQVRLNENVTGTLPRIETSYTSMKYQEAALITTFQ